MKYSTLPHDIYTRIRNWVISLWRKFRDWAQVTKANILALALEHYGPEISRFTAEIEIIADLEISNAITLDTARRNPDQPIEPRSIRRHKDDPRDSTEAEATVVVTVRNPDSGEAEKVVVTVRVRLPMGSREIELVAEAAALGMIDAVATSPAQGIDPTSTVTSTTIISIR